MDLRPDSTLGSYRIIRPLGRGGMGVVYEVMHVELGVRRALKVFTRVDDEDLHRRFLAEGRLLARLVHPCLVRVYDLGVDTATGLAWFAMDLVLDGHGVPRTLEDVRRSGDVTEGQAARWFSELREALSYVHGMGVAHRDVKLENVLLDAEGHAVLSDFGVSRILNPELRSATGGTTTSTFVGTALQRPVMGTLGYLSPEVKAGFPATSVADLYALGVLMFRLLTGIWYEPGTDALALLEPFDWTWDVTLAPLLEADPERRVFPSSDPVPRAEIGRPPLRWLLLLLIVVGGIALFGGGLYWWGRRSSVDVDSFEEIFGVPSSYGTWEGMR